MKLKSGHETLPLEGSTKEKLLRDFRGYGNGLVRLHPGRWLYPTNYQKFADRVYSFKYRKSDVMVMTWPKCGTTWTQEIIWTMRNNPNLNHPDAHLDVGKRSPFIESDMLRPILSKDATTADHPYLDQFREMCPDKDPADGVALQVAEVMPNPRTIKTHLPFSLLDPSIMDIAKVVYVARNPKDIVVSFHHHNRVIKGHDYVGSFDDYVQYFVDGDIMYSPYWPHLKEVWEKRDHPNLHFIFYEDLKENTMEELKKLDAFLETNLTEAQLKDIAIYTSFEETKKRDDINQKKSGNDKAFMNLDVLKKDGSLFRKGQAGDWKNRLTPEQDKKMDRWIEKHLSSLGIIFKYGH